MMRKLIKCGIAGGLVLFVWGMISWTVLPWHKMYMMKFQNERDVADCIKDNAPASGVYFLPNMMNLHRDSPEMAKAKESMRMGPFMFASVRLEGKNPSMVGPLVKEFILKVVAACLVTWLLMQTKLPFKKKVGFITMAGVIIALMVAVPDMIWFGIPGGFAAACIFDVVVGWFLAGLAIAKLSK